ncbi:hypothetical protein ACTQZS_14190 [Bilifractor sp. LCP19S3_H10]|uniref:hypothetical protein n=1 Tax=Bilifractor sp. LCP19S3_H10 TaxID=3438736 RepID=UPI003F8EA3DA
MDVKERIETIMFIDLIHQNPSFCKEAGISDVSKFRNGDSDQPDMPQVMLVTDTNREGGDAE